MSGFSTLPPVNVSSCLGFFHSNTAAQNVKKNIPRSLENSRSTKSITKAWWWPHNHHITIDKFCLKTNKRIAWKQRQVSIKTHPFKVPLFLFCFLLLGGGPPSTFTWWPRFYRGNVLKAQRNHKDFGPCSSELEKNMKKKHFPGELWPEVFQFKSFW